MASIALADDPPCCNVERGKQRGDAVPLVVVTVSRRLIRSHREHGLAAVQRLDLRLLVGAQHDSRLGRSHVEADDVTHLGDEVAVG